MSRPGVGQNHTANWRNYAMELEKELAVLEGRSAADHIRYQGDLEIKVLNLTRQLADLREMTRVIVKHKRIPMAKYDAVGCWVVPKPFIAALEEWETTFTKY